MDRIHSSSKAWRTPRFNVLVAENEPAIRALIATILEDAGYQVIAASDGVEALRLFRSDLPDLLITDLSMPHMDGTELCRLVKQISEVPVILISGRHSEELRSASISADADAYMTKPLDPKKLIVVVRSLVTGRDYW